MKQCSADNCSAPVLAKSLCKLHYSRLRAIRDAVNLCACGCGEKTAYTYKHGHHTRLFSPEEQSRRGRQNDGSKQRDRGRADGYRKVGGRHEHRIVAEQKLGRPLQKGEIVHHRDHNKKNNHPDNLEIMTQSEHIKAHRADLKKK